MTDTDLDQAVAEVSAKVAEWRGGKADLEYADRAMSQMQRCLDAARADLAEMRALWERAEERAESACVVLDSVRAERDRIRLLWDALNAERDVWLARADRAEASAANHADRLRCIAQTVIERIGAPGPESTEETVARLLGALDRAEAERDVAKAARALPGGRDRGAKLPVPLPATCGECSNLRGFHCEAFGLSMRVVDTMPPPTTCPLRAELAKATP